MLGWSGSSGAGAGEAGARASPMTEISLQLATSSLGSTPRRRLSMDGDSSSEASLSPPLSKALLYPSSHHSPTPTLNRSNSCPTNDQAFPQRSTLRRELGLSSSSVASGGTEILGASSEDLSSELPVPRLTLTSVLGTPLSQLSFPEDMGEWGLSVTVESVASVFEREEEEGPGPVAASPDDDPDSRDSGFSDDAPLGPASAPPTLVCPVDFAQPCGLPPKAPSRTATTWRAAPLAKTASGLSAVDDEDHGLSMGMDAASSQSSLSTASTASASSASYLGPFHEATMRSLESGSLKERPPPRRLLGGTPPSSKARPAIRRSRPVSDFPRRKSGLALLQAGAPSQAILGSQKPPLAPRSLNVLAQVSTVPKAASLKRRAAVTMESESDSALKRRKSALTSVNSFRLPVPKPLRPHLGRSMSESVLSGKQERGLKGDYSAPLLLPTIPMSAKEAKVRDTISAETLARLLRGEMGGEVEEVVLVDCRYPEEFLGGHIRGAENLFEAEAAEGRFFRPCPAPSRRTVFVYYCEFSQKRGPAMWNRVRDLDRKLHAENYPQVAYPEQYLLAKGYKNFHALYPDLCQGGYVRMLAIPDAKLNGYNRRSQSVTEADGTVRLSKRSSTRLARVSTSTALLHPTAAADALHPLAGLRPLASSPGVSAPNLSSPPQ